MNFSNENLLIIIVLISIVIMFLTSDSVCKNQEQFSSCKNREQFNDSDNARRIGPSDLSSMFETINVCDDVKCKGRNPEICTGGDCVPVVTGGPKFNNCKYKTESGCVAGFDSTPINIDPCGKRSPKICTTSNCCDIKQLKKFNK